MSVTMPLPHPISSTLFGQWSATAFVRVMMCWCHRIVTAIDMVVVMVIVMVNGDDGCDEWCC